MRGKWRKRRENERKENMKKDKDKVAFVGKV